MGDVLSEVEDLERRIRLLRNRERLDPDYSGKLRRAIRELEDELRRLREVPNDQPWREVPDE